MSPRGGDLRAWAESLFSWLVVVLVAGFVAVTAASSLTIPYLAWDSHAYWVALRATDPYAGARVGVIGSFLYPPPFLQLLAPLGRLPWPIFAFGWSALLVATAIALLRRVPGRLHWLLPLLVWVAAADIWAGNINVLLAFAVVAAIRHPALWPAVGLTKLTPLVGALWHLFRREWRGAALAAGLTAGVVALSWVGAPTLWSDWFSNVVFGRPIDGYEQSLPVPLALRLPAAVALVWWGARAGRPVVVPLACSLALPVIWLNGGAMALGAAALVDMRVATAIQTAHSQRPGIALGELGHYARELGRYARGLGRS